MPRTNDGRMRWLVASAALAGLLAATGMSAQGIPPTQPTSLPSNAAMQANVEGTSTQGGRVAHRPHTAVITYRDGIVDVRANDSSLNQILRAIARQTGLKITGGVKEERVFGNYGPAPIATVLATLLGGTGTNLLYLAGDAETAPKLILTPRGGGATPPGPESLTYASYDQPDAGDGKTGAVQNGAAQPVAKSAASGAGDSGTHEAGGAVAVGAAGPASIAAPANNVNGSPANTSPTASTMPTTHSVPLDSVPTPSTTPSTSGIVDAPNPPAPGSTTGTAPNGTLTPEQVYQQLLKQQQQQQQAKPAGNGTAPQR